MFLLYSDRHTPHLAIKHLVHFHNCRERTDWVVGKVKRFWNCFGRCVLVWFAYPGFDFMCPAWLMESRRAPGHVHFFARIIETGLVCTAVYVWPFRDTAERAFDLMWVWVAVGAAAARAALFIVLGTYASWIKFSHEERALVRDVYTYARAHARTGTRGRVAHVHAVCLRVRRDRPGAGACEGN